MWLEGGHEATEACPSTINIYQPLLNYQQSSQVKIYTETGVGAQHHTSRFKAIDYVKKGDGGSNKKWQAIYSNVIFDKDTFTNIAENRYNLIFHPQF